MLVIQDKRHDGFIRSMGNIDNPESVLHMYKNGYIAATNNYLKEILKTEDGTSHAQLEDNNVADDNYMGNNYFGHTWDYIEDKYIQFPPDNEDAEWNDGWLASNTYL